VHTKTTTTTPYMFSTDSRNVAVRKYFAVLDQRTAVAWPQNFKWPKTINVKNEESHYIW